MHQIEGAAIEGICACVPANAVANDAKTAAVTGIVTRRVAVPGVTVVDLCVKAAERVMRDTGTSPGDFGAVIFVSFTQHWRMPCAAVQAQTRLGLPRDVIAFDVTLACSGWGYGLYLAGLLAGRTGKKTLLLDGDVQSEFLDGGDVSTASLLSDGGTATVVGAAGESSGAWRFAFAADGAGGGVLRLEHGGRIEMDGFGVFRFVAVEVVGLLKEFAAGAAPVEWFVPHQANVYVVRQLAKSVGFPEKATAVSCDRLGNLSSASVPATIAWCGVRGKVRFAGFGGGLSISAGDIDVGADRPLSVVET